MKKTIERMLSFILSAILTANLLSVPILADEATERESLYSNDELSSTNEEIPSDNNTKGSADPEIDTGAGTDAGTGTGVGKENDSYSEIPANTEVHTNTEDSTDIVDHTDAKDHTDTDEHINTEDHTGTDDHTNTENHTNTDDHTDAEYHTDTKDSIDTEDSRNIHTDGEALIPETVSAVSAPSQNAIATGDAGADASKGDYPSKDSSSLEADGAGESNENDGSFSFTLNENSSGNTVTIHQNDSLTVKGSSFSKPLSGLQNLGNIYLSFIRKDAVRLPMDFGGDYDSAMDRFDIPLKGTLNEAKTEVTFDGFNLYDYMLRNTNGIPVPAGTYRLRINAYYRPQGYAVDQSQYYWSARDVKVEWQQTDGPTVTTESLHEGIFGTAYSSTLAATPKTSGHTVEWSIIPTFMSQYDLRNMYGLSLTSGGTLSGTIPSGDGMSNAYVNIHFRATEKETGKYTDIFLPLKISHEGGLSINTYSLPMAGLNWPYSAAIDVVPSSGLTFTIARSDDSPVKKEANETEWLSINPTTGELSGTPTAAGTYRYKVTVSKDNYQPKSHTYSITVRPGVIFQVTGLFDKEYASVYYSKNNGSSYTLLGQVKGKRDNASVSETNSYSFALKDADEANGINMLKLVRSTAFGDTKYEKAVTTDAGSTREVPQLGADDIREYSITDVKAGDDNVVDRATVLLKKTINSTNTIAAANTVQTNGRNEKIYRLRNGEGVNQTADVSAEVWLSDNALSKKYTTTVASDKVIFSNEGTISITLSAYTFNGIITGTITDTNTQSGSNYVIGASVTGTQRLSNGEIISKTTATNKDGQYTLSGFVTNDTQKSVTVAVNMYGYSPAQSQYEVTLNGNTATQGFSMTSYMGKSATVKLSGIKTLGELYKPRFKSGYDFPLMIIWERTIAEMVSISCMG